MRLRPLGGFSTPLAGFDLSKPSSTASFRAALKQMWMFQTDFAERPLVAGAGPLPESIPRSRQRQIQYLTVTSGCPVSWISMRTAERDIGARRNAWYRAATCRRFSRRSEVGFLANPLSRSSPYSAP